jgi:integrase
MARPRRASGSVFPRKDSAFWWISYWDREGRRVQESTATTDRQEAERFLRKRLDARDDGSLSSFLASKNLTFGEWADWYLEMRSKPPFRSQKTHLMNVNAIKLIRPTFGSTRLSDITPEAIESYLKHRLKSGKRVRTGLGIQFRGKLKPMTVHQEFRVLRRMLNVAVKQKRLASNPCNSAEFPIPINHTIRKPHYMTSTEQQKIEFCAPSHLKNIVVIISEMGLRPYKELMPMKKSDVDLENSIVHIPDSKTPSGIGDMPMTPLALEAFKAQIASTPSTKYLFPSSKMRSKKPYISTLKTTWTATLRRAKVPYFPLYHLRHTFATRLSAGGVSDHFVTLMLRQGDAQVFKRYSQATLNMKREALTRLDRTANEHLANSATAKPN